MASAKGSRSEMRLGSHRTMLAAAAVAALVAAPALIIAPIPTYNPSPLAPAELDRLAAADGWQIDRLRTDDGVALVGLVHPTQAKDAPWVLFLPGNGAEELRKGQAYLSRLALGPGWGLAVFALRGFDASQGVPERDALIDDTLRVQRHLRERYGVTPQDLHLVGFSFGTGLALYLAASLVREGETPPGIVLLSTEGTALRWWMRNPGIAAHWSWPDLYDVTPLLADLHMPFLIVEGSRDLFGPHELRHRLGTQVTYLELRDGDHTASLDRPEALDAVRAFLSQRVPAVGIATTPGSGA